MHPKGFWVTRKPELGPWAHGQFTDFSSRLHHRFNRRRDAARMPSQPVLRGIVLLVVSLLPSLGAAQYWTGDCAPGRDIDELAIGLYFGAIFALFGPFYVLLQGGMVTLLGGAWLLIDMVVLRGIFVTGMRFVEGRSQWKIDGEYVWGYVILSLLPGMWMILNVTVIGLWARFHAH
jgi:hypothetical protein